MIGNHHGLPAPHALEHLTRALVELTNANFAEHVDLLCATH
jgi:hypothetical protein